MKTRILFVCLGNICRSPSAEGVFKHIVSKKGESANFYIDSAGTSAWHEGEKADARMRKHAKKRGFELTSISRKFVQEDFDRFDYIIAMDQENMAELRKLAKSKSDLAKLHFMTDYSRKHNYNHVPDPYFGGEEGFELVMDLLEDAGMGLYEELKEKEV